MFVCVFVCVLVVCVFVCTVQFFLNVTQYIMQRYTVHRATIAACARQLSLFNYFGVSGITVCFVCLISMGFASDKIVAIEQEKVTLVILAAVLCPPSG